ncbi:hypothetical protein LC085_13500 [Bacillus tianshenii]|uniref:hypothetical protein n=1 Tax=Sutcliffiella tianshenii TaxID=1463404 RepID=UPI001CD2C336|nr:hypothetical protein [Bacillus tianshenii]MCA1320933.1 hypothetical protein [Bacillus tianshenii]
MKRLLLMVMILLFLAACSSQEKSMEPAKDTVLIEVKNSTEYEIYSLELRYYHTEMLFGSQQTMKAEDGPRLRKGESLAFILEESDLNFEQEVFFELALIDVLNNRKRVVIGEKFPLTLKKGKRYQLKLTGDAPNNLAVTGLEEES